jgi:hypothetical protein
MVPIFAICVDMLLQNSLIWQFCLLAQAVVAVMEFGWVLSASLYYCVLSVKTRENKALKPWR